MKNKFVIVAAFISLGLTSSCGDDFLEKTPLGAANESTLTNAAGVNAALIAAYSLLDGVGAGPNFTSAGSNWIYGEVASDNAYKGSDVGDQAQITTIERYQGQADIGAFNDRWVALYDGVSRSNDVLKLLAKATDVKDAEKKQITAEARCLRGWYHLEAKKMWNMVS